MGREMTLKSCKVGQSGKGRDELILISDLAVATFFFFNVFFILRSKGCKWITPLQVCPRRMQPDATKSLQSMRLAGLEDIVFCHVHRFNIHVKYITEKQHGTRK